MPVDDHGIRADIIKGALPTVNRMIPGQLYEQFINRTSEFVRREIVRLFNTPEVAFAHMIAYIDKINPNYADIIRKRCTTLESKITMLETCRDNGIILVIPPFLNTISLENMLKLEEYYGSYSTPVTYKTYNSRGELNTHRTKYKVMIGAKYLYLLNNLPSISAKATSISHVDQYGVPTKPSTSAKMKSPISITPVRLGEDEHRLIQAAAGSDAAIRLFCLYANSPIYVDMLAEALLTANKPSALSSIPVSTETMIQSNNIVGVTRHLFSTIGVDIEHTQFTEEDKQYEVKS